MLKVQIFKGEVIKFDFVEFPKKIFDEDILSEENFVGDIKISGELANDDSVFIIRGKIQCQKNIICDRCLNQSVRKQNFDFEEEIDESEIVENFFDMTELVRDIILANQPIQNLCKDDCKGLCPVCGMNLNEGECGCDRLVIDPRLAPLRSLILD